MSQRDVEDARRDAGQLRVIESRWQNVFASFFQCTIHCDSPFMDGPWFLRLVFRNENNAVFSALPIDRVKVFGEILTPKIYLLIFVIEHPYMILAKS